MPPVLGHWHSLLARHARLLKDAAQKVSNALDAQFISRPPANLELLVARNTPKHPLHPIARIRQNQSRWYTTVRQTIRTFTSDTRATIARPDRSSFPKSRVATFVNQSSGRAPFASTLRPNLTGGTLSRTANGYSLGGGKVGGSRYFSHGPASQSHVVQNVSQAIRAFVTQGNKAQFDGHSPISGSPMFRTVSTKQYEASRKLQQLPKLTPGSWVQFPINPTITALTSLRTVAGYDSLNEEDTTHLNTDGLLNCLSADFSRALKDLAIVLNDLGRLSALGNLPITCEASVLKVHFPGCDSDTVNRICEELGIQRGNVVQDEDFAAFAGVEMALLFPFAPSSAVSQSYYGSLLEPPPPIAMAREYYPDSVDVDDLLASPEDELALSTASTLSEGEMVGPVGCDPWASGSSFESLRSDCDERGEDIPFEYQGFEGIYKFIKECENAARR